MDKMEKARREVQKAMEYKEKGNLVRSSDWKKFKQCREKYEKHMENAAECDGDAAYQLAVYYSWHNYDWNQRNFDLQYRGTTSGYRPKAIDWLIKAAELGSVEAMETLGRQYKKDSNDELALFWLQKADAKGHKRAWQTIYQIQRKTDKEKAFYLLEAHASSVIEDTNDWYALELAREYKERGETEKSFQWYSMLAKKENSDAIVELGDVHYCKKEYAQAVEMYQKAISLGNWIAAGKFKNCVNKKQGITESDAFRWYLDLRCQKRGESSGFSSRSIFDWATEQCGIAYLDGVGVAADRNKAFSMLSSLEHLSVEGNARLGDCYYYGYGTLRDYQQAAKQYEKVNSYSAGRWNSYAGEFSLLRISELTWCYYTTREYDKAIPMMKALAQANEKGEVVFGSNPSFYVWPIKHKYLWAYEGLGICYLKGYGVAEDRKQAFSLFYQGVQNGAGGVARYYLGYCYENGHGTEKNLEEALRWYTDAAARGEKTAAQRKQVLEQALNKSVGAIGNQNKPTISATTKVSSKPSAAATQKTDTKSNVKTSDAHKELDNLIGLQNVKNAVKTIENQTIGNRLRKAQGLSEVKTTKHMVFTGNPGTGKTTVARIIAEILKENGVLSKGQLVETDAEGLVEGYIRQTAAKTAAKVKEAIGGVLFIDEAYGLVAEDNSRDFGPEAITTLVKMMDDNRDDLIVIVAGYKGKMKSFIDANDGLRSRFTTYIDFPDYTAEEMQQIYDRMAKKENYLVTDEAKVCLMEIWAASKDYVNFGNGRGVRNVFEKTQDKQLSRVVQQRLSDKNSLRTVLAEDIPTADEVFVEL